MVDILVAPMDGAFRASCSFIALERLDADGLAELAERRNLIPEFAPDDPESQVSKMTFDGGDLRAFARAINSRESYKDWLGRSHVGQVSRG